MSSLSREEQLENIKSALRTGSVYGRINGITAPSIPSFIHVNPDALDAFTSMLKGLRTPKTKSPPWWLSAALRIHGYACFYCGQALADEGEQPTDHTAPAIADHLIPLLGGGPDFDSAVVPCCLACKASKSSQDWLTWGKAVDPADVRALRLHLSRQTFNHLARDPERVKTKLQIERMLDARWTLPRGKIWASVTTGGAFVGWRDSVAALGSEWHWLLVNHGAKAQPVNRTKGGRFRAEVFSFDQPRQAVLAIWALIERNALVRRLDLSPAFPDATPPENPALANWTFTSPNVGDLVRRRFAKPGKWKRHSEEWNKGLVIREVRGGDPLPA